MNRARPAALLMLSLATAARAELSLLDADVPVAPIPATSFAGLTNVFQLRNSSMSVTIAPDAGRIVRIGFDRTDDLLRVDEPLLAGAAASVASENWRNYGGDWLWPVAQSRWKQMQDNDWPPPELFRNARWVGQAWNSQDGAQYCLLGLELGAPLHVRIRRLIRLDPRLARIDIRQRIERTAPSTIPACLWNISQIAGAERVVVPVDNGYRVLAFAPPDDTVAASCASATVFSVAQGSEHKIGSDSPRAWIAAQKGRTVIIESASTEDPAGDFPDGGCRVEMYSNKGLGYAEIETLSAERNLGAGERLSNTLRIECYAVSRNLSACELAGKIRAWRGETAEATAQAAP